MRKSIILALILALSGTALAMQAFYPTVFTSVSGTKSATYATTSPTLIQFQGTVAGTYAVGGGTGYPFAKDVNIGPFVANGTVAFTLASSAAASPGRVYIQAGSNPVQY